MGLLRTILIIVLVYYAVKFCVRFFGPYLINKAVQKVHKKAKEQQYSQKENTVEEGKTVIDKKPSNSKQSNDSVGEYVDFEEID